MDIDIKPSGSGYCPVWTRTLLGALVELEGRQCRLVHAYAEGLATVEELEPRDPTRPTERVRHVVPYDIRLRYLESRENSRGNRITYHFGTFDRAQEFLTEERKVLR